MFADPVEKGVLAFVDAFAVFELINYKMQLVEGVIRRFGSLVLRIGFLRLRFGWRLRAKGPTPEHT